ncbi:hypothetical protein VTK26DRAFT_7685 [Humicola hyalothermophila]
MWKAQWSVNTCGSISAWPRLPIPRGRSSQLILSNCRRPVHGATSALNFGCWLTNNRSARASILSKSAKQHRTDSRILKYPFRLHLTSPVDERIPYATFESTEQQL